MKHLISTGKLLQFASQSEADLFLNSQTRMPVITDSGNSCSNQTNNKGLVLMIIAGVLILGATYWYYHYKPIEDDLN